MIGYLHEIKTIIMISKIRRYYILPIGNGLNGFYWRYVYCLM